MLRSLRSITMSCVIHKAHPNYLHPACISPPHSNPHDTAPLTVSCIRRIGVYLATSRDGIHFDTSWVYAGQPLLPAGRCRPRPGCASLQELKEHLGSAWAHHAALPRVQV